MSSKVFPHDRDDCDSCRSFDAGMAVDVLDDHGGLGQRSRWCERCAGPLLARLVLQGHTAVVAPLDSPLPRRESVASEVRRRRDAGKPSSTWNVDFAVEVLRLAQPSASVFLRALVDEGGTASAERLKERTSSDKLHHMTQTLNTAARSLWVGPVPGDASRLFVAQRLHDPDNPRDKTVRGYALPAEHVSIWDEALQRLNR
ncbi:hypothetical protein [Lentzea sp. NPDC055074]